VTIPAVKQQISVALLCALTLIGACGKSGRNADLEQREPTSPPPSMSELRAVLDAELARLGKDPGRVASEAPAGDENRVFDLTAFAVELNAPSGATAPEGVVLQWTEKLVGDYDENGLVTIGDLTPLANAKFWDHGLAYVDPRGEGAKWPSPDGNDPAEMFDPIWRLARVDGNPDGLVTMGDISPIAKHLGEGLAGYRVYRKAVGDAEYTELSGSVFAGLIEDSLEGKLEIPRAAGFPNKFDGPPVPDLNGNVHYVFFDNDVPSPGEYDYLVAPYDSVSGGEGIRSFTFTVDYPADPTIVGPNRPDPPKPYLFVVPDSDNAPFKVHFSIDSLHYNLPVNNSDIVAGFMWDFESDGLIDAATGQQWQVYHTYEIPGHYKATLYGIQPGGHSVSSDTVDIDVKDNGNSLPVASLSAAPSSGNAPLNVTLDASASTDLEGIATYEFDPTGVGAFVTSPGPSMDFNYSEGEFDAVVRITDTAGAQATAMTHVSVGAVDNDPPVLNITNQTPPVAYAPEVVQFTFAFDDPEDQQMTLGLDYENDGTIDDSLQVDAPDNIILVDYGNDGTFDSSFSALPGSLDWNHSYDEFGSHALRAVLTDNWGASDEETNTFVLLENHPPDAQLIADVTSGPAPLTVNFDASGSSDADAGQTLSYYWDFTGTGSFAGPLSAQESFTYYEYGLRGAWVRVMDEKGSYDDAFVEITATSGWEVPLYIVGPATDGLNTPEISTAIVNGNPAVAYVRSGKLFFARSNSPDGTSWTSAALIDAPAWGAVEPALSEINGVPAIAYLTQDGDVRYVYAQDADGVGWNAPLVLYNISGNGAACDLQLINGNPAVAWVDSLSHLRYIRALTVSGDLWPGSPIDLSANGTYVFSQEIEMKVVAGMPSIAACGQTDLHYFHALDADGTAWGLPQTPFTGTLRHAAGMDVVPGLPDLPVIAFWQSDGLYATTANDPAGLSWTAPVQILASEPIGQFSAPEVEIARIGGTMATMSRTSDYFASNDALGTSWGAKSGIFNFSNDLFSYDLMEVGGKPFVVIEDHTGLGICLLH
jgi:PKD repeat protein